jgi:hypothetical protein
MPRKKRKKRFNPGVDRCYACTEPATGDEHVPPESSFPPSYSRSKLVTVPACAAHNNDNAKDVEYVRNVICIQFGTNEAAEEVAAVAERSWDRSEGLFKHTFHDMHGATVDGEGEVGVFTVHLPRVKHVVAAIAQALYFRETESNADTDFEVFCAFHSKNSLQGLPDGTERIGTMLASLEYTGRPTPYPDAFAYRIHRGRDVLVFAMCFYERLWCYAWFRTAPRSSSG